MKHALLFHTTDCVFLAVSSATEACVNSREYLELQNEWPFFNTKASFFRGNSPFFLHFQSKKLAFYIVILYLPLPSTRAGPAGSPSGLSYSG